MKHLTLVALLFCLHLPERVVEFALLQQGDTVHHQVVGADRVTHDPMYGSASLIDSKWFGYLIFYDKAYTVIIDKDTLIGTVVGSSQGTTYVTLCQ